jgi:hypothetical protein
MTFRVVHCAECKIFQVDMVKKAMKWTCKVCNTKQTIGQIFYQSDQAKECRGKVQKLNMEYHKDSNEEGNVGLEKELSGKKRNPIFSFLKSLNIIKTDEKDEDGANEKILMNTENIERTDDEILAMLDG